MNGDISYDIGLAHFSTLAPSFSSHEFKKKNIQFNSFFLYHTNHHHTVRKKENTIFVDFLNLFTI